MTNEPIVLAMSGASGVAYGLRLLECLVQADYPVYLLISKAARAVFRLEEDIIIPDEAAGIADYFAERCQVSAELITAFAEQDWTAPVASGSGIPSKMVICPCSSSCVSAIAHGASDNLLERAADVMIKEKGQLILVHRETPLSVIHLENLLKLAQAGVTVLPASPGFYHKPQHLNDLVDFVVARVLNQLKIPQQLLPAWGSI